MDGFGFIVAVSYYMVEVTNDQKFKVSAAEANTRGKT